MIYAVTEVNGKQDFGTISRLSSSSRKAGTGSPSAEARTSTTNRVFPSPQGAVLRVANFRRGRTGLGAVRVDGQVTEDAV